MWRPRLSPKLLISVFSDFAFVPNMEQSPGGAAEQAGPPPPSADNLVLVPSEMKFCAWSFKLQTQLGFHYPVQNARLSYLLKIGTI